MNYLTRHPQGSSNIGSPFVPLFIGGGRLARHFLEYFRLKKIPYKHLSDSRTLRGIGDQLDQVTHLWLLVSDDALAGLSATLSARYPSLRQIHSSAATSLPHALTIHPLFSFGPELYTLDQYESFPLTVVEEELQRAPELDGIIKIHFKNRIHKIKSLDRGRYHIACSMISNFSILLWSAALKAAPGLESDLFLPILNQTLQNFIQLKDAALTGPLARGDQSTLNQHLQILEGSPESGLYRAFMEYYAHRS